MSYHRYYVECIHHDDAQGIVVGAQDEADARRHAAWVIARLRGWLTVTFGTIRMVE